jgi:hypothetical protein
LVQANTASVMIECNFLDFFQIFIPFSSCYPRSQLEHIFETLSTSHQ